MIHPSTRRASLVVALFGLLMAAPVTAQLVPQYHYLRFNEGTGSVTADLAMPGLAGTAPTLNAGAGWDTTTPILGTAALQPGAATGTDVRTHAPLVVTGDWTIEIWIKQNSTTTGTFGYFFGDNTAGGFRAFQNGAAGTNNVILRGPFPDVIGIGGAANPGTWTHCAWVYDSVALTITPYVNGVGGTPVATTAVTLAGTDPLGLEVGGYSAGIYPGEVDEFRFWNVARSAADILANMNVELSNFTDDMGADAVIAPVNPAGACGVLTAAETVTMRVRNTGLNTIGAGTPLTVAYQIDSQPAVVELAFTANNLNTGQTENITFNTLGDFSAPGPHTVNVAVTYLNDLNPANDQFAKTVMGGGGLVISSFPFTENFDGFGASNGSTAPPPGWIQDTADGGGTGTDVDWYFRNGPTPSVVTGPSADHSTGVAGAGFYAHIEDASELAAVNLLTPCLDMTLLGAPALVFWMHSLNAGTTTPATLAIDVLTYPGAVPVMNAFGPIGATGSGWTLQTLDLSAFAGQLIQLRFRGNSQNGGSLHDIAIDDVTVADVIPNSGQAPQPGFAVLDINDALDVNGLPVAFGSNGPHATTVAVGSQLRFDISGAPNQPIVLMAGPTFINLLPVPPIGQIDIGTGISGATGLPTGIALVGDGTHLAYPDLFFRTPSSGHQTIIFPMPVLPPGYFTTFQAILFTGTPAVIAFTNAVELNAM